MHVDIIAKGGRGRSLIKAPTLTKPRKQREEDVVEQQKEEIAKLKEEMRKKDDEIFELVVLMDNPQSKKKDA